ncbi:unnamed protein product [Brachionus calyciflorus]|uniref:Uncharacterized protein n=1 Tax=Brachionus calyciflorus TaxID=104777 RepID=A0A814L2L7_9BILA|nr:unnamed protein product [Brachionus calyciflorus]
MNKNQLEIKKILHINEFDSKRKSCNNLSEKNDYLIDLFYPDNSYGPGSNRENNEFITPRFNLGEDEARSKYDFRDEDNEIFQTELLDYAKNRKLNRKQNISKTCIEPKNDIFKSNKVSKMKKSISMDQGMQNNIYNIKQNENNAKKLSRNNFDDTKSYFINFQNLEKIRKSNYLDQSENIKDYKRESSSYFAKNSRKEKVIIQKTDFNFLVKNDSDDEFFY